jgi:hypothetical protein
MALLPRQPTRVTKVNQSETRLRAKGQRPRVHGRVYEPESEQEEVVGQDEDDGSELLG